jgi:signal transduction histidine kinase
VLVSWDRNTSVRAAERITFSETIRYDGDLYGHIHMDWLATGIRRQIENHVVRARYWIAFILTGCALCLFVTVYGLVSSPLSQIHRRLLGLAQGDLETRIAMQGAREIVALGDAVNTLLDTLIAKREHEQELEQAREELFDAKERAEVTLHSIGDALITTDAVGQVEYLNPVAEHLTGWSQAAARADDSMRCSGSWTRPPASPATTRSTPHCGRNRS